MIQERQDRPPANLQIILGCTGPTYAKTNSQDHLPITSRAWCKRIFDPIDKLICIKSTTTTYASLPSDSESLSCASLAHTITRSISRISQYLSQCFLAKRIAIVRSLLESAGKI